MKKLLTMIVDKKKKTIAYEYDYFGDVLTDRIEYYNHFEILE